MFGTLANQNTLNSYLASLGSRIMDFGEDKAYAAVMMLFAAHNEQTQMLIDLFCETTTEAQTLYGAAAEMEAMILSEYGTPDAQTVQAGENLGTPLRNYGLALQWTYLWLLTHTVEDLQSQVNALLTGDIRNVKRAILRPLFKPTGSTYLDRNGKVPLNLVIKPLLNADGGAIPPDPYGNLFDSSTHTHYLANAGGFTEAFANALIETILEHNDQAEMRLYINRAQEPTMRGFAGFDKYVDSRIVVGANTQYAGGQPLDRNRVYDRAIGVFGPAEVWVKPWMPPNYQMPHDVSKKVLRYRRRDIDGFGLLRLDFEDESHPLRAKGWAREFGVSVGTRHAAAVGYTGGGTYVEPASVG